MRHEKVNQMFLNYNYDVFVFPVDNGFDFG